MEKSRRSLVQLLPLVALGTVGAGVALYAILSLIYRPHAFELGEEAAFGHFDPHTLVAVQSAQWNGADLRVALSLRNTAVEMSIEPQTLNVVVLDAANREYLPGDPIDRTPVPAGETRRLTYRFVVPTEAHQPQLWITKRNVLTEHIPALDRTILTGKLVFPLPPRP